MNREKRSGVGFSRAGALLIYLLLLLVVLGLIFIYWQEGVTGQGWLLIKQSVHSYKVMDLVTGGVYLSFIPTVILCLGLWLDGFWKILGKR